MCYFKWECRRVTDKYCFQISCTLSIDNKATVQYIWVIQTTSMKDCKFTPMLTPTYKTKKMKVMNEQLSSGTIPSGTSEKLHAIGRAICLVTLYEQWQNNSCLIRLQGQIHEEQIIPFIIHLHLCLCLCLWWTRLTNQHWDNRDS